MLVLGAVGGLAGPTKRPASLEPTTSRIASCVVTGETGSSSKWFADYRTVNSGHRTRIYLDDAGVRSTGASVASDLSHPWVISWTGSDHEPSIIQRSGSELRGTHYSTNEMQLLSPDGKCILFLSIAAPPRHRVAVIGDSIFSDIAQTAARDALGSDSYARSWQIDAVPGNGWNSPPATWPGAVDGGWALSADRGLLVNRPSVVVAELGADDALRAVFAKATSKPALAGELLAGVSTAVNELIDEDSARVACTVLVTAPSFPIQIYGAGQSYLEQSELVNSVIRDQASRGGAKVRVADWAAVSASHHTSSRSGVWFMPDDVHPNRAGQLALLSLVHHVIQTCPSAPAGGH